jgi:hypothetical protein
MSEDSPERQMRASLDLLNAHHRSYTSEMEQLFGPAWFDPSQIEPANAAAARNISRQALQIHERGSAAFDAEMDKAKAISPSLSPDQYQEYQEYAQAFTDFSNTLNRGREAIRHLHNAMVAKGEVEAEFTPKEFLDSFRPPTESRVPSEPALQREGQQDIRNYDVKRPGGRFRERMEKIKATSAHLLSQSKEKLARHVGLRRGP